MLPIIQRIASAIANARASRRGAPPVVNVLEILPEKLRVEVLDDAKTVLTYLGDGVREIAFERDRQILEKGFDAAHDDRHDDGSILTAAGRIIYDLEGGTHTSDPELENDPDATWPEVLSSHVLRKYGEDPIMRLRIAGALIAAEIDRLRRQRTTNNPQLTETQS